MISIDQRIGIRLRGKRRALALSQDELAAALGVPTETIAAYENAIVRVPVEHLTKLADIMEMPVSFFML